MVKSPSLNHIYSCSSCHDDLNDVYSPSPVVFTNTYPFTGQTQFEWTLLRNDYMTICFGNFVRHSVTIMSCFFMTSCNKKIINLLFIICVPLKQYNSCIVMNHCMAKLGKDLSKEFKYTDSNHEDTISLFLNYSFIKS